MSLFWDSRLGRYSLSQGGGRSIVRGLLAHGVSQLQDLFLQLAAVRAAVEVLGEFGAGGLQVDQRQSIFAGHCVNPSLDCRHACKRLRARERRDMTVPMGTPETSEISL